MIKSTQQTDYKHNMKYLVILFSLLLFSNPIIGQSANKQKIKLSITQECFPGPNPIIAYKVSGKSFRIQRTQKVLRQKFKVTDEIYSSKFNRIQEDSLRLILSEIDLLKYEKSYSSAILDGIAWDFNISSTYGKKEISLWNYYLPDFGKILDFLNRQLPKDKRYISFDLLGIRNNFNNK
jgi:hypothetical protein